MLQIKILSKYLFIYLIIEEMKSSRVKLTYEKKRLVGYTFKMLE